MSVWILALGAAVQVLSGLTAASSARAENLVVGDLDSSLKNSYPFGDTSPDLNDDIVAASPPGSHTPQYQQVYNYNEFSSFFSGEAGAKPIKINKIRFFEEQTQIGNPGLLGGTFTLQIGTTDKDVCGTPGQGNCLDKNDFSGNFADSPTVITVFEDLATTDGVWTQGQFLDFAFGPFVYDPSLEKNLLIDIQISDYGAEVSDLTKGLTALDFEASKDDLGVFSVFSLVSNFDGNNNNSFGLVTQFFFTIIPEPSTFLLLAAGLLVLGTRRSRAATR